MCMLDRRRRGSRRKEFHRVGHEPVHRRKQRPHRRLHGHPDRVFTAVKKRRDTQANVIAVANGFKSRRAIISEAGGDIENVLDEIAADEQLAAEKGVEINADRAED